MQLNTDDCSSEMLEYNLKISRPTEKMLEKQKRNKRKSKIFLQRKHTNSDDDLNSFSNFNTQNDLTDTNKEDQERKSSPDNEKPSQRMFNFIKEDCDDTPKKHIYTLELFQKLSVEDNLNSESNASSAEKDRENLFVNQIRQIWKDLSEEVEEKTTTSSEFVSITQPNFYFNKSKNTTHFSEKFKSSSFKESLPSKRFKG
jgi:hypothetical protein